MALAGNRPLRCHNFHPSERRDRVTTLAPEKKRDTVHRCADAPYGFRYLERRDRVTTLAPKINPP